MTKMLRIIPIYEMDGDKRVLTGVRVEVKASKHNHWHCIKRCASETEARLYLNKRKGEFQEHENS